MGIATRGKLKLFLLEDNQDHIPILKKYIDQIEENVSLIVIESKSEFLTAIEKGLPDLIIADYHLPDFSGTEALDIIKEIAPELPFILISGYLNEEKAIEAMLSGAADFIPKDNLKRFVPAIKRELKKYSQYQKQKIKATEHEEKFKSLAKTTDGIVWEADSDSLALEYVSPQIQNILGFPPDYWYENAEVWRNRVYKDDLERVVEFYNSLKEGSFYHIEFRIIRSDGSILWVKDSAAKYTSASGQKVLRGLLVDITEQKRKEIQLKQLLEEKENLLLEVHHRVKNNLAIVSGMMQLQMYSEGDERVRERLMDSVGRIKTIASIQETLYKSKSFTSLKIDEELNNLLEEIQSQFDPEYNIKVDLSTKEVELNVNQGIPLALIVFEIVSNAMKHAFNGINEPKIKVILKNLKDSVTLKIEDNGVGLPNEINKFEETKTLGLTITSALCEQIGAVPKLVFDENGTRFEISFVKSSRKGSSNAMLQN